MRTDRACFLGCLLATLVGAGGGAVAQERCATPQRDSVLARRVPGWAASRQKLEDLVQETVRAQAGPLSRLRTANLLIRIPVVVHVVHNNAAGTVGGANNGNISDAQILSQIRVLNEDYRRLPGTNGFNANPVGADLEIEFVLATRDPNGNPTNGITRTYTTRPDFDVFNDAATLANLASWPSDRYLNIWVVTLGAGGYLGIAQYPSAEGVPGLDMSEAELAATDGVIIDHRAFGSNTGTAISGIYKDGRTATHEIGHWLGLIHTWGDEVCGTDYCADTPPAERANRSRNCTELFSTCNGVRTRNMIENYLDYSPDLCMNTFTNDQKKRVRATLQASPRRRRLVNSVAALPETDALTVSVFGNPVNSDGVVITAQFQGRREVTLRLFDWQGRLLSTQRYDDQPGSQFRVGTAGLRAGMYLLQVQAGNEKAAQRLVVAN